MLSSCVPNGVQTEKYPPTMIDWKFRSVVKQGTAAICKNVGFTHVDGNVLELLTQMMLSHINEACCATKLVTENSGRTAATPSDALLALIDLGTDVSSLAEYFNKLKTTGSLVVCPPKKANPQAPPKSLKVGETRPHPQHIPTWMPPFPDPHTYIRTTVSGDPDTAYSKLRELNAQNQRNVDNALKNYMLRVHPSLSLFRGYEAKVREDARRKIEERRREKETQLLLQRRQLKRSKPKVENHDHLLDNFLEDGPEESEDVDMEQGEEPSEDNEVAEQIAYEQMFGLQETEMSILRTFIEPSCQILIPKDEDFPYVTALLAGDMQDEGEDTKPSTPINGGGTMGASK
ncbi:hypothetical protein L596_011005 [Steinernema carpocapsae]|uniref:Transcription initiation factor TFIID subunit 8 n=1 Tax=Steinernema carpocapsae TaxID=34508 RepID=A0A4U5NRY6_STECR|nr:hypothetical protein L596_011005 [Steinernema carpocapsae]